MGKFEENAGKLPTRFCCGILIALALFGGPSYAQTKSTAPGSQYHVTLQWLNAVRGRRAPKEMRPGNYGRKFSFQGRNRFYEFHVPPRYSFNNKVALVFVFHGRESYPGVVRYQSGMDEVSDTHNFVAVYPAGSGRRFDDQLLTWNAGVCCGYAKALQVDDVSFVGKVLHDIDKFVSVDKKRVFATGISNGALMSYRLAAELSESFAAIAPVAGQVSNKPFSRSKRPVAIMHFHGMKDRNSPYFGGVVSKSILGTMVSPVEQAVMSWAKMYRCPSMLPEVKRVRSATRKRFYPCKDGVDVILWTLETGGHTWPGGKMTVADRKLRLGPVSHELNASEVMWEFFSKNAR